MACFTCADDESNPDERQATSSTRAEAGPERCPVLVERGLAKVHRLGPGSKLEQIEAQLDGLMEQALVGFALLTSNQASTSLLDNRQSVLSQLQAKQYSGSKHSTLQVNMSTVSSSRVVF